MSTVAQEMSTKGSKNSRKNASGSRTGPGWEHRYDVVGNSRKAKCKYCDKIVNGGIFHFKHHLACTRRDVEVCISVPDNVKKKMLSFLFTSDFWKSSRFSKIQEGKFVQKTILDGRFWRNVVTCLKAASPLIKALRLVDSEESAMGFIYKAMDTAKEKIKVNFGVWKIIDERWENQFHHPLHAIGYFLNPVYQYSPDFEADSRVKNGLYDCMKRMIDDQDVRSVIHEQLESFKKAKGLFDRDAAKLTVHTKKRNHLHQKRMNDLVFVYYNLKMQGKKSKEDSQTLTTFKEFPSDNWITEAPSSIGLNLVDEDDDANINSDPLELINLVDDVDNLEGTQITVLM
ncbi:uncharacterized protein LOC121986716 [Zingiber officinale]|uniref:uncharacterized protein LOC121986716 n=1 Tax=Zingiber officinale TaxID=94328 RepID=UPI001C4CDA79|nr:uncharacterized protein LOC121986716 [Zingiber officinale]